MPGGAGAFHVLFARQYGKVWLFKIDSLKANMDERQAHF
jgi:hypothetical protein